MTLYVARHGQTRLNREWRFQGSTDEPLDETGLAQAKALAERVPAGIGLLAVSPLLRARQTAGYVAQRQGLEMVLMEEFRERAFGVFEGLGQEELESQYAELWHGGIVREWDAAPPGGETIREVKMRVERGLTRLREGAHEPVLLVAHSFVARMIKLLLNGLPESTIYDGEMLGNAEFETYRLPRN
ncbi:MAG: hypothetical protein BSR46_15615 [Candidatus Dactylopiibacterium carminicum]|nr:MAG: hypothetical protein BSR46_15615 [Candidatus Dactylopiibacterium carminicum]